MNELIKNIERQCWNHQTNHLDSQKFAEWIIRECICQCDDENSQKYIMDHFGMKLSDWS